MWMFWEKWFVWIVVEDNEQKAVSGWWLYDIKDVLNAVFQYIPMIVIVKHPSLEHSYTFVNVTLDWKKLWKFGVPFSNCKLRSSQFLCVSFFSLSLSSACNPKVFLFLHEHHRDCLDIWAMCIFTLASLQWTYLIHTKWNVIQQRCLSSRHSRSNKRKGTFIFAYYVW